MSVRNARGVLLAAAAACAATMSSAPATCSARLAPEQRKVLAHYLSAIKGRRYADAFALLSHGERAYFGSWQNFASAYAADKIVLFSYRMVASQASPLGTLAYVEERIGFYDYAHEAPVALKAKVGYIVAGSLAKPWIGDPSHPWRALAPTALETTAQRVRVTVRKISFFTGRLEIVATFSNVGENVVTLLPYGKSVARDDAGKTYLPIRSTLAGLTDKTLFAGLRLAGNARYTGSMSFLTPNRFTPKVLSLTFAPALRDGADTPFAIGVPPFAVTLGRMARP